jgi:hypothetical protein
VLGLNPESVKSELAQEIYGFGVVEAAYDSGGLAFLQLAFDLVGFDFLPAVSNLNG